LAYFDKIWHDDAYWPPTSGLQLKFQVFENPDGGGRHLNIAKSRYLNNGLTDLHNPWKCKMNHAILDNH